MTAVWALLVVVASAGGLIAGIEHGRGHHGACYVVLTTLIFGVVTLAAEAVKGVVK